MAESETPWRSYIRVLLLHPSEPQIGLLSTAAGWTLPQIEIARGIWSPLIEPVLDALRAACQIDLVVLRCAHSAYDREQRRIDLLYVAEPRALTALPVGLRWFATPPDLLAVPDHAPLIEAALAEVQHAAPIAERPPWAERGWFAAAEAWIAAQIGQLGAAASGPVAQLKTWGISCVLRAPSTRGALFFKVSSEGPLFGNEPLVMDALARRFPAAVPTPLAIERGRRWLLLDDFGPTLRERHDDAAWPAVIDTIAHLQRASIDEIPALLAVGCLDRRLDHLAREIAALLVDEELVQPFPAEAIGTLREHLPLFQAQCRQLAGAEIPASLVHGDLHDGNIVIRDSGPALFDWSDVCIAHPFFDLVTLLDSLPNGTDERRALLLDRYLAAWLDYAPIERLRDIWTIAQPLGALHQVLSYFHIYRSLEPASRHEMTSGVRYWIDHTLALLTAQAATPG